MRKYWLGALTIVLIAVGAWLFTELFEQYEKEIYAGYSKEAKLNPYLAAKYFLEKNDVKVLEQTAVLDFNLIPTGDTVFLSMVDSMLLSETQIDKALAWVEQGGFLIVGVGKEIEGHDSFLQRFDIEPTDTKKSDDNEENSNGQLAEAIAGFVEQNTEPELYTVNLTDDAGQLQVQLLDTIVLNHPHIDKGTHAINEASEQAPYKLIVSVSDDKGPRLLQFDYGEGSFTALSNTKIWQNKHIGKADHAHLLAYLAPQKFTAHLFYNVTSPSLWELLNRYFLELLIACAALLLLWLWRVGLRVEGIKLVAEGQRRMFAEHLTASAEFLVSKKQYQTLLTPIKEDITAQMQLFHLGFMQLEINAQTALIAERAEVPERTVQAWVDYTNIVNNQDELMKALKLGNAIRRKL